MLSQSGHRARTGRIQDMKIEVEQEEDGRWIAEVTGVFAVSA
jgi:acyl-coenzyme A thioesterase PaaI-like protein